MTTAQQMVSELRKKTKERFSVEIWETQSGKLWVFLEAWEGGRGTGKMKTLFGQSSSCESEAEAQKLKEELEALK